MSISWKIIFYEISQNNKPIQQFILNQEEQTRSKIAHLIDLLEEHGNMLRMPYAKQLENNLYELRIRGKNEIRIFYCFQHRTIFFLHIFQKKTQKTPRKEIEIAKKRKLLLTSI